jgi:hypothetical protein
MNQSKTEYDRMNPDKATLIERLHTYSQITYGANAYPLSIAEAKLILALETEIRSLKLEIENNAIEELNEFRAMTIRILRDNI